MTTILVVEDEESFREPLTFSLRRDGYQVIAAADGESALRQFEKNKIDLVLLDLMLPGISGTDVCKQIRAKSQLPIIMVTAKDDVVDRIIGLELGADDYVSKPYSYRELLARIRAVLRRNSQGESTGSILEVAGLRMDVERHVVTLEGEELNLPLREFELLEFLLRNAGRVLTRGQIIDRVWGSNYVGDTKTLDVHVKRLRSKIEEDPAHPQRIVTFRGLGYKLVPQED
ncbi:response regulator transcription factor [Boudabousia marimammalium]|uniref:Sensory transduction protein RegX3 n=1 Tax=Boudabousia marimammalium TaxID=156892 RepID=A0A1Q5PM76_9ACTO|nr:response regulator transcription factor [Boudabousia marimammalium]OKL48637.1 DNA-binding response regulator [Boudabousia marimammalium]